MTATRLTNEHPNGSWHLAVLLAMWSNYTMRLRCDSLISRHHAHVFGRSSELVD